MDAVTERKYDSQPHSGARRLNLVDLPAPFKLNPIKIDGIIGYDIDNAYPSRMERLINASITAKAAAGMYKRFLSGSGFVDQSLNDVIVGYDNYKKITALDLLQKIARSISYFNGAYIRAQFTGFDVSGLRLEPFRYCRLGDMDDIDYSGKIIIYNNWDKWRNSKMEKGKYLKVDVWNPNKEVIASQVKRDGGFEKWKGQMFYSFLEDEYVYPLSPIDPVKWDTDTESQISIFKNGELRRGFFLKYLMYHNSFPDEQSAKDFTQQMSGFMGGDHAKSMMILEGTFNLDGTLNSQENIKVEKLEQNINDKMFEGYETSTKNSIRKAYNAIPNILLEYEDQKLSGTSGSALKEACFFYNQMTLEQRMKISQIFTELFANWIDPSFRNRNWKIKELSFDPITPSV